MRKCKWNLTRCSATGRHITMKTVCFFSFTVEETRAFVGVVLLRRLDILWEENEWEGLFQGKKGNR